jgi:hypothetical protein
MFLSSSDLFCSVALLRALISSILSALKQFCRAVSTWCLAWFIDSICIQFMVSSSYYIFIGECTIIVKKYSITVNHNFWLL